MGADRYVYPGTTVLRNTTRVRDQPALSALEGAVGALALAELAVAALPGGYDLAHLQAFHRFVFGELYPWVGELRSAISPVGPERLLSDGGAATEDGFGCLAEVVGWLLQ